LLLTSIANITITVFQAASTPLNPLSFQCGFVKLRIDLLQAFSQLICTCNSLKTSPPPAIATTIAMTSGNDLQRCGRISNQARVLVPLLNSYVSGVSVYFASQQTYRSFRLDVRVKFSTQSGEVLAQLPREAADAPSLEVFKAGLDGALGSLSWCLIE